MSHHHAFTIPDPAPTRKMVKITRRKRPATLKMYLDNGNKPVNSFFTVIRSDFKADLDVVPKVTIEVVKLAKFPFTAYLIYHLS